MILKFLRNVIPGCFRLSFQTTKCRRIKTLLNATWSVEKVSLRHSCAQFGTRSVRSDVCCFRHARSSIWSGNVSPLQLPWRAVHKDNAMLLSPTQTAADNSRCTVQLNGDNVFKFQVVLNESLEKRLVLVPFVVLGSCYPFERTFHKTLKRMLSIGTWESKCVTE